MSGRQVARNGPEKVRRSQQGILGDVKDVFLYLVSIGKLLISGNGIISCASYSVLKERPNGVQNCSQQDHPEVVVIWVSVAVVGCYGIINS